MLPADVVRAWVDAFNRGDLEAILALYSDDIRTESPLLLKLRPEGPPRLEGKAALRDYFSRALAGASRPPAFTPLHLLASGDVVILEYDREAPHGGSPGVAERFIVHDGKIVESRVFWSADKIRDSL
jgi:ketosteroid isomerase-like protein